MGKIFNLYKKIIIFTLLVTLLTCPINSFASIIPNPLALDTKCYFIKGYKKTTVITNSQFSRTIKRIAQLEGLISYLSILERPSGEVCNVDNENYNEIIAELTLLESSVYKAARGMTSLSKTKKRIAFIQDSVSEISSEIAGLEERIADLDGLKKALRKGESYPTIISGVNNTNIHEVMAELWIADRYKAELDNRLVFWQELSKRFKIKSE